MTARQLESRIGALRASLRRLLALHGLSWVLGLTLPLLIVAGFADWLFHLDSVIRAVILAAVIGTVLFLIYGRVLRPLFVRFADLDIAMRIEERWPGLNDRLASTIQFLRMDAGDDRYGSSALAGGDRPPGDRRDERDRFPQGHRDAAGGACPGPGDRFAGAGGPDGLRRPGILADRHETVDPPVRRAGMAPADAPRPGRGEHHPQARPRRLLHALGEGPAG